MRSNLIGLTLLLVAGLVLVHNLPHWQDLEFGDETTYLGSGVSFSIPFQGGAQWGPLYAAWYSFWHIFVPDRLDLYYFNWGLLTVAAGLAVFSFLRALQLNLWIALWIALLFLFSSQNLPLNPKISVLPFSIILGLLALVHVYYSKLTKTSLLLITSFTGLMCAYMRPEFYLSFLLAGGLALIVLLARGDYKSGATWIVIGLFSIGTTGLHLLFGNPVVDGKGDRSALAFQQHFVVNYCKWKKKQEPATIDQQTKLFKQIMGNDVSTLTDGLIKQPMWTLRHITSNITDSVKGNLKNLMDIFFYTPFKGWNPTVRLLVFWGFMLLFALIIDYPNTWKGMRRVSVRTWGAVALLILLFPSLVATVLVYPRTHYLVFQLILSFWLLAHLINLLKFRTMNISKQSASLFLATTGLVAYLIFISVKIAEYSSVGPTPNADNVRFIQTLKPNKRLRILERHWYRVFLPYTTNWVHVESYNGTGFAQFVKQEDVNFILMTKDMQEYFAKDSSFQNFSNRYSEEGFTRFRTNPEGAYLLAQKDIFD